MLKFWELAPSPNNLKVRMALRYKGIDFEAVPVDARERRDIIRVSGQELTPVIEDRGIVLHDSEAILHYLDANYREAPRLYPAERAGRYAADAWRKRLDSTLVPFWRPVFMTAIGVQEGFKAGDRQGFEDALRRLDGELGERDSFCGAEMPVCDLRVAEWAVYALPGPRLLQRVHLFERIRELFGVEQGRLTNLERFLQPWDERLG